MLVANTKGGPAKWYVLMASRTGELKQFTLNDAHNAVTATASAGLGAYTSAKSVAYNVDATNIYYNKEKQGKFSLSKCSNTYSSNVIVLPANGSGDVRKGNDDKLYSALPNTAKIYKITDGGPPTKDSLYASIGTKFTGGIQRVNHLIWNGVSNCTNTDYYARNIFRKQYELKDHLGNVRVVISDLKKWTDGDADNIPDGGEFTASVASYNNFYAFGALQPDRNWNSNSYRYGGAGGQEKDDEIIGVTGAHTTAEYWEYDTRLGRRWNLDPIPQIGASDYSVMGNNPIFYTDILGNTFTPAAKEAANEISSRAAELATLDKAELRRIKGLKGDHKNEINEIKGRLQAYKQVQKELKALQNSSQVYDVQFTDATDYQGKTSFDLNTGNVVLSIAKSSYSTNPITALANEFTHAYQFETGALSLISGGISDRGGMLLDSYDEYESEKRDKLLNYSSDYGKYNYQTYLEHDEFKVTHYDNNGNVTYSGYLRPLGPIGLNSKDENGVKYKSLLKAQLRNSTSQSIEFEVFKGWKKYTNNIPKAK